MIPGYWYTDCNLDITLETEMDQSAADSVSVLVMFPDRSIQEYPGTVVSFSRIRFRLPAADNTQDGEHKLQAAAVVGGLVQNPGEVETIWIHSRFAVTP
jgi:hypothetical protein